MKKLLSKKVKYSKAEATIIGLSLAGLVGMYIFTKKAYEKAHLERIANTVELEKKVEQISKERQEMIDDFMENSEE